MAGDAVSFLMEQVKETLGAGFPDLMSGGETELMNLSSELSLLKAVHMDVAKKKTNEGIYRELENQIKEAVYDVEYLIDICLTKAKDRKSYRWIPISVLSSIPILGSKRFSLAKDVKSIREEKVTPILNRVQKYFSQQQQQSIDDDSGVKLDPRSSLRRRDSPIRDSGIVGFLDEEKKVAEYLMGTTEELDVIPIIGIPGLGKTTLAWKIYGDEAICYCFPTRIWISISEEEFNIRDVFLQILRPFSPSQSDDLSDEKLAQVIYNCLEKEKFLLVLDNVWSVDVWNQVKVVLPFKNGAGKVLITTREMAVATRSCRERKPHMLRFLTTDESYALLRNEVFGNENDMPKELGSIIKHIAIKCEGVPLAVVIVGGIIADKIASLPKAAAASEWEIMWDHVIDSLQHGQVARRITDVVELSYRILPDDLKQCFVYMGVFPEDYEIPGAMLTALWISEGFVLPKDGKRLEDIAEEKLSDLVSRSLLTVEKRNHTGEPRTFRVPKMIRAFCINKSREINLYQEVTELETGVFKPSPTEIQNIHRLCVNSSTNKFFSTTPNGPRVRSFLCFLDQAGEFEPRIAECFPRVRILECTSIKLDRFPTTFTKLIHLRYLTLYVDTLDVLPETITQLWNLISFVIETKSRTIIMKEDIWSLVRLRYLKTKAAILLDDMKSGGEAAGDLQTLNTLSAESCTALVSKRAKNLRTLGIYGKLARVFETEFLENLRRLEKLKLVNSLTCELLRLPQPNAFPPNLTRLTLTNTRLGWQHMPTLAMIKKLETLKLKDNAFVGASWKAAGYDFPALQLLLIVCTDLVLWEAREDTFPSLRFLVVKNCQKLEEIPECFGTLLERLEVDRLPSSAIESARKIEQTKNAKLPGKVGVQFNLRVGLASDN